MGKDNLVEETIELQKVAKAFSTITMGWGLPQSTAEGGGHIPEPLLQAVALRVPESAVECGHIAE